MSFAGVLRRFRPDLRFALEHDVCAIPADFLVEAKVLSCRSCSLGLDLRTPAPDHGLTITFFRYQHISSFPAYVRELWPHQDGWEALQGPWGSILRRAVEMV
jgi:hypothetical protein